MKTSLLNKIKFYFTYRKAVKENLPRLIGQFNLRKDKVDRLYTVVNLPDDVVIYGKDLTEKYIKKYISDVDAVFKEIGISQLVNIIDGRTIDKTNYLLVFGYSGFNTAKIANRFLITILLSIAGIVLANIFWI